MIILRIIFSLIAYWLLSPIGVTSTWMLLAYLLAALAIGFSAAYIVAIPIRMMLQIKQRDYPNE